MFHVEQKTIAIYAKNEAYIHYASAWFRLRDYDVVVIDLIDDNIRKKYRVLDRQIWDSWEFEEFLENEF